ncbi:MAG: DUF1499 domain-containing protein [Acidobacteriota bacterium]|nr:DUF1499 domain-containing protein [Acidobacteriota bacterium]
MNSTTALASPLLAGLALVTGLVGVLEARFGLISPLIGFALFSALMPVGLFLSLLLGSIGLLRTRRSQRRGGASQAWAGVLLSVAVLGWLSVLGYETVQAPAIHDITTDIDDPPVFEAAAAEDSRGAGFAYPSGGAAVPDQQRRAYPELHTLHLDISRAEAVWRVRHTAEDLGWAPIFDDPENGRFEFSDATPWFRFLDFVAVRVRAEDAATAIDVRSVSQVGVGDLGENAARIGRFLDVLGHGH